MTFPEWKFDFALDRAERRWKEAEEKRQRRTSAAQPGAESLRPPPVADASATTGQARVAVPTAVVPTKIATPPGHWVVRGLPYLPKAIRKVVEQEVADMREEHFLALQSGNKPAATLQEIYGYAAIARALTNFGLGKVIKFLLSLFGGGGEPPGPGKS